MHIHYFRDIPLALGALAILIGLWRGGSTVTPCVTPDGENPQWFCGAVLNFVGVVLLAFAALGHFTPK